jgi:hypothetical protein
MPQVMPTKVLDSRFHHRYIEPVSPIFKRFTPFWLTGTHALSRRPVMQNLKGGQRSII